MAKFIDAYNTITGDKVYVPETYVDLFSNISKTPKTRAAEKHAPQKKDG